VSIERTLKSDKINGVDGNDKTNAKECNNKLKMEKEIKNYLQERMMVTTLIKKKETLDWWKVVMVLII
jgi:hypothetical protein